MQVLTELLNTHVLSTIALYITDGKVLAELPDSVLVLASKDVVGKRVLSPKEAVFVLQMRNDYNDREKMEVALCEGLLEVVKYLHEEKGVRITPDISYTVAEGGNYELFKYLEFSGMKITPYLLSSACSGGNLGIINNLLMRGYRPIAECLENTVTNGHLEAYNLINGYRFEKDRIALIDKAVEFNRIEFVKKMIGTSTDAIVRRALFQASSYGRMEILELVYKTCRDIPVTDIQEVFSKSISKNNGNVVRFFLSKQKQSFNLQQSFYRACKNGYEKSVEAFLDVVKDDIYWRDGIEAASEEGHKHIVELFIRKGYDVDPFTRQYFNL